jgi:hypothetical protein
MVTKYVATLALGSWPKQRLVKVQAKSEAWESHFMLPGVWESVREWTPTLPSDVKVFPSLYMTMNTILNSQ